MPGSELNLHFVSEEEDNLQKLNHWLNYEISSVGLGGLAFFIPFGLVLTLLKWAAVIFTPCMLWRLFKARRFGWIVGFGIFVVLPFLAGWFMVKDDLIASIFTSMIPLAAFYLYTCVLRVVVGEWLEKLRWEGELTEKAFHHTA